MSDITTKTLRCVTCPQGCLMEACINELGEIISITGNTCQRGEQYARSELTHPIRTLTSSVFSTDGRKIPVRTSAPISKELLFDAMKEIHSLTIPTPVHRGDILVRDFMEKGIFLVVTKDIL